MAGPVNQPKFVHMLCLNVCGLRKKLSDGILEQYITNFDIVCLVETKTDYLNENMLPRCFEYLSKEKSDKDKFPFGGIHGIGVLVRDRISDCISVLKNGKSETILWLHITKKAFGFSFILGVVYIPPENSKYYDISMFDDIATDLIMLKNVYNLPVCLLGDFNARTGAESELLEYEELIDCSNNHFIDKSESWVNQPFPSHVISLKRKNCDTVVNNHGHKFLEICKNFNLVITNGRVGTDRHRGDFTCANVSTIDYCAVSSDLIHFLDDFEVDIFDPLLSDKHNPIILKFVDLSNKKK